MKESHRTPEDAPARSRARRDFLVVGGLAAAVFALGALTHVWEPLHAALRRVAGNSEGDLIAASALAALAFAVLTILRWRQASQETSRRQEAEHRFRTLIEEVPAITYTWEPASPTGTAAVPYVSPQIEDILGYTPEEWRSDSRFWIDRVHPDDRARVAAASDLADRTGEPFSQEYRTITKDGREVWLRDESVVVDRGPEGRPLRSQGVMLDITREKHAERALAEAESRFRTIVERVPAVAYVWDGADAPGSAPATYISPQIESLLGFTATSWLEDPTIWQQRLHPDDVERVLAAWGRAVAEGTAFSQEYRITASDGRMMWLRDEAVPVSEGHRGRPLYQGVMFDVTERRQAEELLAVAEEQFRVLVEHIPAITYIEDAVTEETLYISPQIEEMLGYTPDEWLADPQLWTARLHPDDRDWVIAMNASDTGDTWQVDYRSIARDGRTIWVHNDAMLIHNEDGSPRYWQGVVFEITARKEAEERLSEAEARYRSLVEQLPAVVYINAVDDVSTATYVSPQYERLLGFSPQERTANPDLWVHQLHPDDRDRVLAESLRTNETGDPFDVEYRMFRKDGSVVWLHDQAYMVGGEDGHPPFWQGVLFDITDRRTGQDTLARRDEILETVGFAAERFLNAPSWTEAIDEVLARLGHAAWASRAYVFENERDDAGNLLQSQRFEWSADGVRSTLTKEHNHRFPYRAGGFERWERLLGAGRVIHGPTREFPASERPDLEEDDVLSCFVMPISVGGEWWGFIGFDHCFEERVWQQAEIDALTVAATTLGAAIGRERAERRLTETEMRYQTLVEQIPAITYIEDPTSGRALYISPQLEQVLGYRREEMTRDAFWASLHPDDRDRVRAEDERTNLTGDPYRVEYRQRAADGRWVWMRDEAILVRDQHGNPLYWQGIRLDVTAQKDTEEQLREAEGKYRTLIETVPAVTYIDTVSEPVRATYMSPQIEAMLGFTSEEWVDDPNLWDRHLDPASRDAVLRAVERHNAGEPFDVEYRFRAKDGSWHWIRDQALVVRDDDGVPLFSQGVMFDVTEEKVAEEQLRATEERFRAIVEHIPAILYVDAPDESQQGVYVSPQVEDILGIKPEDWVGQPHTWQEAIHPDDEPEVMPGYLEAIRRGESWTGEYRMVTPDGRIVWVHDESSILHDEEGKARYLQGVMFDITERKLAEQALLDSERREREAAERLRALDEMKNTFLAAVSHELRSPLTSILGLSLTLERHEELNPEDREDLLGRLSMNARKLDRLLKDLLDIDRLNRGIVAPQYRLTDVGALARRTLGSIDALAGRTVEVATASSVVRVDPAKVERIVENLLVNAARHTEDDRTIWLRVEPRDDGVEIAVDDDGSGVAEELREAIFEPFRQGPTATPHSPGTGIGLSLVARFAELHGGRAWVEDRAGGGASFRVLLPSGPASVDGPEDPDDADLSGALADAG